MALESRVLGVDNAEQLCYDRRMTRYSIVLLMVLVISAAVAAGIGMYHLTGSLVVDGLTAWVVSGLGTFFVVKKAFR